MKLTLLLILIFFHTNLYLASNIATLGLQRISAVSRSAFAAVLQKTEQIKQSVENCLHAIQIDIEEGSGEVKYKLLIPQNSWDSSCRIGECKFSDIKPPEGMTREEWYKRMLYEQENYLRSEILKKLDISQSRYDSYASEIASKLVEAEEKLGKNYKKDADIEKWFLQRGYDCEVGLLDRDYKKNGAVAFSRLICLRPVFNKISNVDKEIVLYHEGSHIKHQDNLYTVVINNLINNYLFCKYVIPEETVTVKSDFSFISRPSVTNDIQAKEKAKELLNEDTKLREYRADMEAFFNVKKEESFKDYSKGKQCYQGFPFIFNINFGYQDQAKTNYLKDFLKGIENDYSAQLSEKEKSQYLRYKKFTFCKNKIFNRKNLMHGVRIGILTELLALGYLCKKGKEVGAFDNILYKYKRYLRTLKFPEENHEILM